MRILPVICFCGIVGLTWAAKLKVPSKNRNEDLFKDDEFTFPVEDNKDPTIYTGNIMKAGILMATIKNKGKGQFKYAVETENGIEVEQIGKLRSDNKTFVVMGSYTYTGANGKRYRVRYTADEFGYHPITELDLDLPEIQPIQPVTRPPTLRPFTTRTTTTPPPVTEDTGYHYEPPSNAYLPSVNAYLPPTNAYLPPTNGYLPPSGVNEPSSEQLPPLFNPLVRG
ncbi:cuticle protein 3 [Toxorhynchites rutilus septentrionalis]|uniref:cuticle protein 3 n=1 Tax=Toxorhynchites rutilus septentrionalis TaxID=329112 RepID=UPI00247AA942|nr:cuticle protein 3 [Toxorhynchites rutilus septentrionalis]